MFNYTTETIFNDLTKFSNVVGALTAPASGVNWDPGIEVGKVALAIAKLNKFVVAGTLDKIQDSKIYKRATSAEQLATRQITIPAVVIGTLYKLGVEITVNGYADGQFARDRVTFGKPFYIEMVPTTTTNSDAATLFANAWNTSFSNYVNFPLATTSGADLIFTSVGNPYIQFKEITLVSINVTSGIETIVAATVSAGTAGVPSFGTYFDMVRNHRLPTIDNYRLFGLNTEELPDPTSTYDQYSFQYFADRGQMGQSIVGEKESSLTTHVLWVKVGAPKVTRHIKGVAGNSGSYSFEELLNALGLTIVNAVTGATITPAVVPESGSAVCSALGNAAAYVILAGSTITNTGTSIVNGNLGLHPGTSVTGIPTPGVLNGVVSLTDSSAAAAKVSAKALYDTLSVSTPDSTLGADIGETTVTAGIYNFLSSAAITGTLILDGENDPNATFVFIIPSTLTTATSAVVTLANGASAGNVYWLVGSSATIGTTTTMVGTIIADQSITMNTGATLNGRAFALVAAVTLDSNLLSGSSCSANPIPPPTTITPTVTPTTVAPTITPTTVAPTVSPTTLAPTTVVPTDSPTTTVPTDSPTTIL